MLNNLLSPCVLVRLNNTECPQWGHHLSSIFPQCSLSSERNSYLRKLWPSWHTVPRRTEAASFETGHFCTLASIHVEHGSTFLLLWIWPDSMWHRSMYLYLNIMLTAVQLLLITDPRITILFQSIVTDIFIMKLFDCSQSCWWQGAGRHQKLWRYWLLICEVQVHILALCPLSQHDLWHFM